MYCSVIDFSISLRIPRFLMSIQYSEEGLTYDANTNRFNDEQIINDLRNRKSTLQDQNKALLQSSASNGPNPQRTQLQLIAAQMQLQDQALQIQLMLDDYAEKVKQQNAFLLNYQQELNYIKSRLTDLDYVMHAIQHANNTKSNGIGRNK
ncbi:hypothetical protein ACOME3_009318 [Neoechinorhynchus agilis]